MKLKEPFSQKSVHGKLPIYEMEVSEIYTKSKWGKGVFVEDLRAWLEGAASLSKPHGKKKQFEEWWEKNKCDLKKVYNATESSKTVIGIAFLAGLDEKRATKAETKLRELLAELNLSSKKKGLRKKN